MLQLNRIYKNSADEEIRIDTISLTRKRSRIVKTSLMETGAADVFERHVKTLNMYTSTDRVVTEIEVIGNFTSIDTASGNFTWAEWTSPSARVSMNDLPIVTDSV